MFPPWFGCRCEDNICYKSNHGYNVPLSISSVKNFGKSLNSIFIKEIIIIPQNILKDVLLGEEIGNVYNRDRLKELVRVSKKKENCQIFIAWLAK